MGGAGSEPTPFGALKIGIPSLFDEPGGNFLVTFFENLGKLDPVEAVAMRQILQKIGVEI